MSSPEKTFGEESGIPRRKCNSRHLYKRTLTTLYSSKPNRKPREKFPLFAQESFDAFEPFINIFGAGRWAMWADARTCEDFACPVHCIDKETADLFRRWKAGEPNLTYPDGTPFLPQYFVMGIYNKYKTRDGIQYKEKHYYTSGNQLGILYNDVDAHQPWQTDQARAKALVDLVQDNVAMWCHSTNGENGYVKIRIDGEVEYYRLLCKEYQRLMRMWLWENEVLCDYEIKGQPHTKTTFGILAKLPFSSKDWNYTKLEEWKSKPIMSMAWLEGRIDLMHDLVKVQEAEQWRLHLERTYKQKDYVPAVPVLTVEADPVPMPVAATIAFPVESVVEMPGIDAPVPVVQVEQAPVDETDSNSARSARLSPRGYAPRLSTLAALKTIHDSFERQHEANLILARQLGRVPTLQEALSNIRQHGLFSGDWHDKESKREQRNAWSLKYIARTFDPKKARKKSSTKRLVWSVDLENLMPSMQKICHCDWDQARAFVRSLLEYMDSHPENAWTWIAGRMTWFGIKANPAKVGKVLHLLQFEGIIEMTQEWFVNGRRFGRQYQVLVRMEDVERSSCSSSTNGNYITTQWSLQDDQRPILSLLTVSTRREDTS